MTDIIKEDLLQYVYGETSKQQDEAIEKAIGSNWELKENLEILQESKQFLDEIKISPREESVLAILEYAKKTRISHF